METKYVIARPVNGITVNGDEYATHESGELALFDDRNQALEFIGDNTGYSPKDEEELEEWTVLRIKEMNFRTLWSQFGNVPINDDEEIEERFYHFPEGTDRFEIWHWFEEAFDVSIGDYQNKGKRNGKNK